MRCTVPGNNDGQSLFARFGMAWGGLACDHSQPDCNYHMTRSCRPISQGTKYQLLMSRLDSTSHERIHVCQTPSAAAAQTLSLSLLAPVSVRVCVCVCVCACVSLSLAMTYWMPCSVTHHTLCTTTNVPLLPYQTPDAHACADVLTWVLLTRL